MSDTTAEHYPCWGWVQPGGIPGPTPAEWRVEYATKAWNAPEWGPWTPFNLTTIFGYEDGYDWGQPPEPTLVAGESAKFRVRPTRRAGDDWTESNVLQAHTPTPTPTNTPTPGGAAGCALYFDGGDHVNLGNDSGLNPTSQYTIEAWVKPAAQSNYNAVFSRWNYPTQGCYSLLIQMESKYRFVTWAPSRNLYSIEPSTPFVWTHLAAVFDNGGVWLYRDGVLQDSDSGAGTHSETILTLIGATIESGTPVARWRGWIDEVRFWGVGRAGDEIQATMNHALLGNEPGLVGYWNFDECEEQENQIVYDRASGLYNGTLGADGEQGDDDPRYCISDAPIGYPLELPYFVFTGDEDSHGGRDVDPR